MKLIKTLIKYGQRFFDVSVFFIKLFLVIFVDLYCKDYYNLS